jgi:hypothetical protein
MQEEQHQQKKNNNTNAKRRKNNTRKAKKKQHIKHLKKIKQHTCKKTSLVSFYNWSLTQTLNNTFASLVGGGCLGNHNLTHDFENWM